METSSPRQNQPIGLLINTSSSQRLFTTIQPRQHPVHCFFTKTKQKALQKGVHGAKDSITARCRPGLVILSVLRR